MNDSVYSDQAPRSAASENTASDRVRHSLLRFVCQNTQGKYVIILKIILFWAQLFKTNDVVSQRIVKTLIIKYGIFANIYAAKMCHFFFSKTNCELDTVVYHFDY